MYQYQSINYITCTTQMQDVNSRENSVLREEEVYRNTGNLFVFCEPKLPLKQSIKKTYITQKSSHTLQFPYQHVRLESKLIQSHFNTLFYLIGICADLGRKMKYRMSILRKESLAMVYKLNLLCGKVDLLACHIFSEGTDINNNYINTSTLTKTKVHYRPSIFLMEFEFHNMATSLILNSRETYE